MSRPEIVAELSCNHMGSLTQALELVDAAAKHGADSVKVQCWDPQRMVLDQSYVLKDGPWQGMPLYRLYKQAHTPWAWIPALFERAARNKVQAFSSVFDTAALAYLEDIGCPRYKIASFELVDLPLIRAVAATGKPMVISTGMGTELDVYQAVKAAHHCRDLTLLHCVSAYPASTEHMNLLRMVDLGRQHSVKVGLSDHSAGNTAAIAATALGATMIEKHFKASSLDQTPDSAFSITPMELARLREDVHTTHCAMILRPMNAEEDPQRTLRRSLYWAKNLAMGHVVTAQDVTTARPALGIAPINLDHIIGAALQRDVTQGHPVTGNEFSQQ